MPSEDGAVNRAARAEPGPQDRLSYATLLVEIGELYDTEAEITEVLSRRPGAVRIGARRYIPLYELVSARLVSSPLPVRPSAR